MGDKLNLWAMSCSHVGTDLRHGRTSLADPIRHSEQGGAEGAPSFDWDIAVHLGDFSGSGDTPTDEEGQEIVRQFSTLTKHTREDFYTLAGNHDAVAEGEPVMWWFRKWIDPDGQNTSFSGVDPSRMRYPVEGTWERYSFRVGNLLFLMMGDRNDLDPPIGRRGSSGGYPPGAVTQETFDWWKSMVDQNQDSIIVSAHHHMLKETTVASGAWEGYVKDENGQWQQTYHAHIPVEGASYLYYVGDKPDAQAFEGYLAEHPGANDLWLGAHTHTHPDDEINGRTHIERKWDVNFINVAALTRHHGSVAHKDRSMPMPPLSRLLTFEDGSDKVRVRCYLHTSDYGPIGWHEKAERVISLNKPFRYR